METLSQTPNADNGMLFENEAPMSRLPHLIRHSPAAWGALFLKDRDSGPRRYRWYQREDLECQATRVIHLDGRAVGKTINLSTYLLWFASVNKGKSVLVGAPYQGHLDTIIEEVEFQIHHVEALKNSLSADSKQPGIRRKPYFQLRFTNGCMVYFRPAGTDGDAFRSLHVDLILLDEAAWLPELAWTTVFQYLNPGGTLRVYSTPNGLRNRTFYKLTQSKNWTLFHWPSWIVPDWNDERRKELLDFYGGEHSSGWLHEAAGEHGMPSYGVFNPAQVMQALTDGLDYQLVRLDGDLFADCADEAETRTRMELLAGLDGGQGTYWLGVDTGYASDPSELLLFEEDENEVLTLVVRIHAEHLPYPLLSELIHLLDQLYSPAGIGLDRGGNGTAVEHELLRLDKYRTAGFAGKLVGVDFGGSTMVGEDKDGQPVKKRTKEHMTALINRALNARKLRLPKEDREIEDQLCTHTYIRSERGIVYSKGNDHIIDALRCALYARDRETGEGYDPVFITPEWPGFYPVTLPWDRN